MMGQIEPIHHQTLEHLIDLLLDAAHLPSGENMEATSPNWGARIYF